MIYLPRALHQILYPRLSGQMLDRIRHTSWSLYRSLSVPLEKEFDIDIRGTAVRLDRPGCANCLGSMYTYGYEQSSWERSVRALMEAVFARGASVFFDVGANVGIYTYIACAISRAIRVYAFEPLPANVAYLQRALHRNGFGNVTVAPVALSDRRGEATFYVPIVPGLPEDYNADMSSLINRFEGSDRRHSHLKAREITVPVMTLDEYVEQHNVERVDILKLDVEEAEVEVLRGAGMTLERARPDIACELLYDNPRKEETFRILTSRGYRAYLITEYGLIPEDTPLFVRARGGHQRLAVWSDHFFTCKDERDSEQLSIAAFGKYNDVQFFREIRDKNRFVVG